MRTIRAGETTAYTKRLVSAKIEPERGAQFRLPSKNIVEVTRMFANSPMVACRYVECEWKSSRNGMRAAECDLSLSLDFLRRYTVQLFGA